MTTSTCLPTPAPRTPLKQLHRHVRKMLGQKVDWLRIYIVNEEEILLAGTCPSSSLRQRVGSIVQAAACGARLRNTIVVDELAPGLRQTDAAAGSGRRAR
jgi:hypothetical protein